MWGGNPFVGGSRYTSVTNNNQGLAPVVLVWYDQGMDKKEKAMKVTYTQAVKGTQSLEYTLYADHAGSKWRVEFRRDFYDHQCKGSADRWDGAVWQPVFKCSPMRLKLGMYSSNMEPYLWEDDAALDAEYMITKAALVIGEAA